MVGHIRIILIPHYRFQDLKIRWIGFTQNDCISEMLCDQRTVNGDQIRI